MKNSNPSSIHPKHLRNIRARQQAKAQEAATLPTPPPSPVTAPIRTTPRDYVNPSVMRVDQCDWVTHPSPRRRRSLTFAPAFPQAA